jgi:hypothetical protein
MSNFTKLSIQVASPIVDQYMELKHGDKQLACTAGLLVYLNANAETQRRFRRWAEDVAEKFMPSDEVPETILSALREIGQTKGTAGKGKKG